MTSATDRIQEYYSPRNHADLSIAAQQPAPRGENLHVQRPLQLKDLKKYSRPEENQEPGCLSSFERSAGGEFKLLWSWVDDLRDKRQQRKAYAGKRKRKDPEEAGQRAPEVLSNSNFTSAPSVATPEELAGIHQPPLASHTHSISSPPQDPSVAKPACAVIPTPQDAILRKPMFKYRDAQGAVPQHSVRVTKPSGLRRSVHLVRTTSDNYRVPGEPRSPKIRNPSRITKFGDFISQEALHTQPSPLSKSLLPLQETVVESILPQQANRGTRWTFTGANASASPPVNLPNTFSSDHTSENRVKHEGCSMCGAPNSPGTCYGDQGLWLCTACRSPRSATEFPPRTTSMAKPEQRRQRSESPVAANARNASNESETCGSCHTSLPPVERDGVLLCSWCCKQLTLPSSLAQGSPRDSSRLTLLRVRRQQSVASVNTQDAEDEWHHFDSHMPHEAKVMPLWSKASHETLLTEENNHKQHWQESGNELTPTPPLKDSIYLSKKAYSPPVRDSSAPSPPARDIARQSSPRTKNSPPQGIRTPDRDSFYPSTPISTSPPAHPTNTYPHRQRRDRARKGSSVYPPTPQFIASNFPYPPPPIPQDPLNIRRALRASSVYTADVADQTPRLRTPDWQLKSPNRDTSFYKFWETILRDDGTTFRDV